jgi:hypothetical protein
MVFEPAAAVPDLAFEPAPDVTSEATASKGAATKRGQ